MQRILTGFFAVAIVALSTVGGFAEGLEIEGLTFAACGNTHCRMSKKAGKDVTLVSEANKVPSGVVRLVELQENGFAYVRP